MPTARRFYKKAQRSLRYAVIRFIKNRRKTGQILDRKLDFADSKIDDKYDLSGMIDFNSAKVLFLRQNAIGDALISTPIYAALKARYPDITIDVMLNRRNQSIYDNDTSIRRIYLIKMRPLDLIPNLRLIRRERYDVIVDLVHSPSTTSAIISLLGRAGVTVGGIREHPSRYPPDTDAMYDIKVRPVIPDGADRMLLRLAECLRILGIEPIRHLLKPTYTPGDKAQAFADALIDRISGSNDGFSPPKRVVGINISGAKAYKFWGSDNYIALLQQIMPQHTASIFLIIYSAEYAEQAKEIAKQTGAVLTGGTPTLDSFAALIARLDTLITTDSSAVHFADVAGVPTVTLMIDSQGHELWCPSVSSYRVVHAKQRELRSISPDAVASAFNALLEDTNEQDTGVSGRPQMVSLTNPDSNLTRGSDSGLGGVGFPYS